MTKISLFLVVMTLLVAGAFSQLSQGPTNPVAQEQLDNLLKWQSKFQEKFPAQQTLYRALVLKVNTKAINDHNADKTKTYTKVINQFSIYTDEQLKQMLMKTRPEFASIKSVLTLEEEAVSALATQDNNGVERNLQIVSATSLLWTSFMTPVKNQRSCGSCWAFGTVAAVESMYKKTKGKTLNLADQQLVDCSYANSYNGCNGGWPSTAFTYIKSKKIFLTSKYPYVYRDQNCQTATITGTKYPIVSFTYIYNIVNSVGNCANTKTQLATGPLTVAVDASGWGSYGSGIFNCQSSSINHAVLLVGYDANGNWRIKNSWGTGWGESGYIWLSPAGAACGVCNYIWKVAV